MNTFQIRFEDLHSTYQALQRIYDKDLIIGKNEYLKNLLYIYHLNMESAKYSVSAEDTKEPMFHMDPGYIKQIEQNIEKLNEAFKNKDQIPTYDSKMFQCLSDFEKCKKSSSSKISCITHYLLCLAQTIVPLAK